MEASVGASRKPEGRGDPSGPADATETRRVAVGCGSRRTPRAPGTPGDPPGLATKVSQTAIAWPHRSQNRASGALTSPHFAHAARASPAPQPLQRAGVGVVLGVARAAAQSRSDVGAVGQPATDRGHPLLRALRQVVERVLRHRRRLAGDVARDRAEVARLEQRDADAQHRKAEEGAPEEAGATERSERAEEAREPDGGQRRATDGEGLAETPELLPLDLLRRVEPLIPVHLRSPHGWSRCAGPRRPGPAGRDHSESGRRTLGAEVARRRDRRLAPAAPESPGPSLPIAGLHGAPTPRRDPISGRERALPAG